MRLDLYNNKLFLRGGSNLKQFFWLIAIEPIFSSFFPGNAWRCAVLRFFGARVGNGVILKPGIKIKFPWRLSVGDHVWIGERVWLDNLVSIEIESHSCISQGAYLCTGSHDWSKETFDLIVKPIRICTSAWVGAFSKIGPGVTVGKGVVVSMGSTVTKDTGEWVIVSTNQTLTIKRRRVDFHV